MDSFIWLTDNANCLQYSSPIGVGANMFDSLELFGTLSSPFMAKYQLTAMDIRRPAV